MSTEDDEPFTMDSPEFSTLKELDKRIDDILINAKDPKGGYICNFCHRQFKFKCYLESHRKTCGKPEKELKDFDMKDLRLLVQHAKTKFNF